MKRRNTRWKQTTNHLLPVTRITDTEGKVTTFNYDGAVPLAEKADFTDMVMYKQDGTPVVVRHNTYAFGNIVYRVGTLDNVPG